MKQMLGYSRIVLIAVTLTVLGISVAAQDQKVGAGDVPLPILTAFKQAFPKAVIRSYSKQTDEGQTYFEIESREGDVVRQVRYSTDAKVTEIKETIDQTKLPRLAQQTIAQKYPRALIMAAEKITTGDKIVFRAAVRNGKQRVTMEFDSEGREIVKPKK